MSSKESKYVVTVYDHDDLSSLYEELEASGRTRLGERFFKVPQLQSYNHSLSCLTKINTSVKM